MLKCASLSKTAILILLVITGCYGRIYAQRATRDERTSNDKLTISERIALRSNLIDWALTIPNIGFDFDLSPSKYNMWTLNANARYNWNTTHTYKPGNVFNLFDIRLEARRYWRTKFKPQISDDTVKHDFLYRIRHEILSTKKINPRTYRAYYAGPYIDYSDYSFKFSKEGYQGHSIGAGISFGFGKPLYEFKKGFLDIEYGMNIGMAYVRYEKYRLDSDGNCYPLTARLRDKVVPAVPEIRIAFIYRNKSVNNKYKYINQDLINARKARRDSIRNVKDSISLARHIRKIEKAHNDSIHYVLNKIRKQQRRDSIANVRIQKHRQDSIQKAIRQIRKDSIRQSQMAPIKSSAFIRKEEQLFHEAVNPTLNSGYNSSDFIINKDKSGVSCILPISYACIFTIKKEEDDGQD